MDRLKAILVDKILDLTSSDSDDVKVRLDKIQRFRDFSNACQSLIAKYPQIEDELIKMVNDGDFDTKIASSRVDSVIRMSEMNGNTNVPQEQDVQESDAPSSMPTHTEDISFEILDATIDNEDEIGYVDFEDVKDIKHREEAILEIETDLSEDELAAIKRKKVIKKVLQIAGIIITVTLLILIIKFVMNNWQTILIVLGVVLLILILVWLLKRKRS